MSPDPIGFAGGDENLYSYVFNDPLSLRDPFGLDPEKLPWYHWKTWGPWVPFVGSSICTGSNMKKAAELGDEVRDLVKKAREARAAGEDASEIEDEIKKKANESLGKACEAAAHGEKFAAELIGKGIVKPGAMRIRGVPARP